MVLRNSCIIIEMSSCLNNQTTLYYSMDDTEVTIDETLRGMKLFYKVLVGRVEFDMSEDEAAKYENLEALIRDELI